MKTFLCSILLLAAMVSLSSAQSLRAAGPNVVPLTPTPPSYCDPCLFYSGDFDSNDDPNILDNGTSLGNIVGPGVVYIPFVIPDGQAWTVRSLFVNEMLTEPVLDPPEAVWSISTGISTGEAGSVVASGRGAATLSPTGRTWAYFTEYTVQVQARELQLQSGTYWLSVIPQCTNENNSSCMLAVYGASDVEDSPPRNSKGISPANHSFYTNARAGDYYRPTSGNLGACNEGCNRFSAGAIGVAEKTAN